MASFEQNQKNKLWSVRFRIVENGLTKNKRLSGFKTKKEANDAYVDYLSFRYIPSIAKEVVTFDKLYHIYYDQNSTELKTSTKYDMDFSYNKHLK